MSGDLLRPWQKWKRKLGVMASDESIVNVVHSSLLTMSVLWQLGEARLLPLLLWNNLFLFASYRLRPATTGIQQPVKGPSNETKGQIGKYKKVRKEECVSRLSSTNPRQWATVPFRINLFWKFKEKMNYWLWEFMAAGSQSWEYHSFGIHFAWQAAVFQYGKSGANRCIAWGAYWAFRRKRTAGCGEDEFGQVTLKLAWRRLQTACGRELLRCSRDTSAESLSLK